MQLSPVLTDLAQYPFARLDDWKADAQARGIGLIDFGMGDPIDRPLPGIVCLNCGRQWPSPEAVWAEAEEASEAKAGATTCG